MSINTDRIKDLAAGGRSQADIAKYMATTRWQVRKALGLLPATAPAVSAGPVADVQEPILRGAAIRKLRSGWRNLDNLAADLRCSKGTLDGLVNHLEESGYLVLRDGRRARIVKEPEAAGKCWTDASPLLAGGWRKIGIVSDTHLASKHARLDVLEAAYDRFKEEGITDVYHAGNMVDGECRFNRYELLAHGITDQALYCLDHYPQRSGVTTHYITGECHEGWWMKREGIDFGRYLSLEAADRGRKDLHYLGFLEADVKLIGPNGKHSYMRVFHPGGGSAYAISYKPQKIVE